MSLNSRLLVTASVVLAAFLGLTGLTLDKAFRESALAAARDRLQAQVYLLLSAAEMDEGGGLSLPDTLPEARFASPASGLFGEVVGSGGEPVWRSASTMSFDISYPSAAYTGEAAFTPFEIDGGPTVFALSFGVTWELDGNAESRYEFRVAESTDSFTDQVAGFRRGLWGWLIAAAAVLLVLQGLILRWGLAPLRRVASEISEIEAGQRHELGSDYPKELRRLTLNLNALISHGRTRLRRYRNALDDLAHSLKTPLAVLRGAADSEASTEELRTTMREEIERMDRTVDYQLHRAAASGRTPLATAVPVVLTARRLASSLEKVYADKRLELEIRIDEATAFNGDEGDLTEILGNLLDNACKWAEHRVVLSSPTVPAANDGSAVTLVIEDDGPGIPEAQLAIVLERGGRSSSHRAGQGIGLAVVREIVEELYGGSLVLDKGSLGGARVQLTL